MARSFRFRRLASLTLASALALGMAACAGDDVGSSSDYATDSFSAPTEHGELRFGGRNSAEFTEDNRFHSWTFKLTAEAEIELKTELFTDNLDSVMYLYQLTEEGTWGSYIDKNDDYDGLLASRIAGTYGAGEYRIKIKATKLAMRGTLAVNASCTGAGCPVDDPAVCNADGPANLPTATGYTTACDATFHALVTMPETAPPADCAAAFEERAVQYYKDYWNDIGYGYDELTYGDEEVEPDVTLMFHNGAGTIVGVGMGGDEDSMDFVFDAAGKLIYYYQHNQSPDWAWFCAEPGEEPMEEPDEDCFRDPIEHSSYDVEDVTEDSGSTPADETESLPPAVGAAVTEYGIVEGVPAGAPVNYDYRLWAGYYTNGAEVTLTAEGYPEVTYVVTGDPEWGMQIVFRTDASGLSYVCKELPRS